MNIDDKRVAVKNLCASYEDCLDGCPLFRNADRCYAAATDEEIERNYRRMKEAEYAHHQKTAR